MAAQAQDARKRITLERTFEASAPELWELWTTPEGIESFWGPDGFEVKVRRLEVRVGGGMEYAMTATGPDQVDYMKKAGMPTTTVHQVTFTEVSPGTRLGYTEMADFIPGVEPYEVTTTIEFIPTQDGVRLVLTFGAMHDDHWTRMAVLGREGELVRLAEILSRRRSKA